MGTRRGKYYICEYGLVGNSSSIKEYKEFGMEYQTQKQAIWASDMMRSYHRQLAWLSENDDNWVADWKNISQTKYNIYFNEEYYIMRTYTDKCLNTIYMSKENAEKLCDLLNRGVVIL